MQGGKRAFVYEQAREEVGCRALERGFVRGAEEGATQEGKVKS